MCGITGFIEPEKNTPVEARAARLAEMCRVITHRGPDDEGRVVRGRAALGMRRLAIIDLAQGQQPIYSADGSKFIVFNGEIYNYRELRKELAARGYRFKTNSDTETIIHAYDEYGPACLEKLRGMFAFAIWDETEQRLFLARDRVGKKPLFYAHLPGGEFVFGSELKSLLAHGGISREIDPAALDAYLTLGYVPEEYCVFKQVSKLAPGSYLVFQNGRVTTERYWDFGYRRIPEIKSEEEYVEGLRREIREAVRVRLISEVPLGAFLSGGIDSSAVVGMMSEIMDEPVKTFSIGFREDSFDELKYARIAARHFRTDHHEFIVTPDLVETVDELVWHFDEPFADSSALPTYMVSKMAREYVTVVLSGDGGDELFAGYTRYVVDRRRGGLLGGAGLPGIFRRGLLRPLSRVLPHGARGKNYLYNVSLDGLDRYIDSVSYFNRMRKKALYSAGFRQRLNGGYGRVEEDFRRIAGRVTTGNRIDKLLYLDSRTNLPADILVKVDRMSMAASLEARVPLLDQKLIEYAVQIPAELKLRGLETKHIFKKALAGLVPDEILHREKQGFGVPIGDWIKTELRGRIHDDLIENRTLERGYFNRSYVGTLLDEHARGRRDHSHALWVLWMLELWHRKFADG